MTAANTKLLTTLNSQPVLGLSMANVSLLRLDRIDSLAPGNKLFKLRPLIEAAQQQGLGRIVSFGGAWSNHLHALAAVAARQGLEVVAIVRGDDGVADTAMLADIRALGVRIERVSRAEYRRRNDPDYLQQLQLCYGPCLVVPEGGSSEEGVRGCSDIAQLIIDSGHPAQKVLLAVGTGTTLAGVVSALPAGREVIGVSALKGATDLEARVNSALAATGAESVASWRILHDAHCGGFARVNAGLKAFMLAFEATQQVPLEPVYTGKVLLAVHRGLAAGEWDASEPLLVVHSGGLQGRRGYPWLAPVAST